MENKNIDRLKKIFEDNPKLYFKFKELVLRVKASEKIGINEAKRIVLSYLFKYNLEDNFSQLRGWLDRKIDLFQEVEFTNPMILKYKPNCIRHRGKGDMLSMVPATLSSKIEINPEEFNLVNI